MTPNSQVPETLTSEINFEGQQRNLLLPTKNVGTLKKGSTTPSVLNCEYWMTSNTAPTLVTDFLYGQNGQELVILGDGFTSVQNGAKIVTLTGADTLLAANKLYRFVRLNNKWFQQ